LLLATHTTKNSVLSTRRLQPRKLPASLLLLAAAVVVAVAVFLLPERPE